MSRPRFLADHDLNEHILDGMLRREPAIEVIRSRDAGMHMRSDAEVLQFAAEQSFLVISHDVNTMSAAAYQRIEEGKSMTGLFLVHQWQPIGAVIDSLVLIWAASDAAEWQNRVEFLP